MTTTSTPSTDPTAAKPKPKPLTIDHFRLWTPLCVLDNGRPWTLEAFWEEIFAELLGGVRELLVVLPTGNYKTTSMGGFSLYHSLYVPDARVPIGASSKDQAAILYEQAAGFVRRTPGLAKRFKVQDGYRRIVCRPSGGLIRVYAADEGTGDGIIPTLAFIDEPHRARNAELHATWRDKLTKRNGQIAAISTAGDDEDNPLEQMRDAARRLPGTRREGAHTIARSPDGSFVMHEYALRSDEDADDLELVKLANPASQITLEELRIRKSSPTMKRWQWLRFTCNVRSKGEHSAIQPDEWDALLDADPGSIEPAGRIAWLDLGWKIDTTAMGVLLWESAERRLVTDVTVLEPPVDESDIVAGLLHLQLRHPEIVGVVYDPNAGAQQMVQLLEKGTHPLQTDDDLRMEHGLPPVAEAGMPPLQFVEHSQDNAPMALAASRFDEALRNGWIRHDGDETLRAHVLNAVEKPLGGDKFKYDRPASARGDKRRKYPIDALTGVLFGNSVAVAQFGAESKKVKPRFRRAT